MNKTFKLPKTKGEAWVVALESGKYEQALGTLVSATNDDAIDLAMEEDEDYTIENPSYCCLGVMGKMCEIDDYLMYGNDLPGDIGNTLLTKVGYPKELLIEQIDCLPLILAALNDGYRLEVYMRYLETYPNIIGLKKPEGSDTMKYNFKEIAQFIKDNVEFYIEK